VFDALKKLINRFRSSSRARQPRGLPVDPREDAFKQLEEQTERFVADTLRAARRHDVISE
jgi:hypothetical protein